MSFVRMTLAAAAALLALYAPTPAHADGTKALRCAFAKQRATVKRIDALLACERKALLAHTPVDQACTAAAEARFEEDFRKAEMRGGCVPEGDVAVLARIGDQCEQRIFLPLQGSCTEAGAQCGSGAPPCCTGLVCIGDIGSTPVCAF